MKRHLKHLAISCALLLGSLCIAGTAHAQSRIQNIPQMTERIPKLDNMSNGELMRSVNLGKYAEMVRKFQNNEATSLLKQKYGDELLYNTKDTTSGFRIETTRNKEIILITIPTDRLFLPNDTELMQGAEIYLNPLKRYLKVPDMYRMILVVHTDNTGSDEYTDNLAIDRVDTIFDWFENEGCHTTYIFPTASGAAEPLKPNISAENRARNRRLEIYLVPGEEMLKRAKSGRLSL